MKKVNIIIAVVTVVLVVFFTAYNPKKTGPLTYNPATEMKTAGVVEDVQEFYCPVTEDRGTHVTLRTDAGNMTVHVAVARFLREHNVSFQKGDRLQVVGAKIRYEGADALIAREITRGEEIFTLRDAAGKPAWSK